MAQGDVTATISRPTGKALLFDGINDNVDCGTSDSLNMASELSILGWFRTIDNIDERHLIRKDTQYAWMQKNTNKMQIYLNDGGWKGPFDSVLTYAINTWTHWALIVKRHSTTQVEITLYKNGVADPLGVQTCGNLAVSANHLFLGSNAAANYFNGKMDDIKIYNRALSADDVLSDYNKKSISPYGMVAYYSFNNTADTGHDDSGTGNNGTPAGAISTGGHDTTEDDIKTARVTAGDKWNFIPLANGQQVMMVHIEEA